MPSLKTGSGLSTEIEPTRAVAEAANEAMARFDGETPNLVVAFLSNDHREFADEVAAMLGERFPAAAVIGCASDGVIGDAYEIESGAAVSIFAAFLPETSVLPFGLRFEERATGEYVYTGWPDSLPPDATILMLCDRFTFPAGHLLQTLNETRPGQVVIGGVAAGGGSKGDTRLFYGGKVYTEGAVAVAISGRVRVHPLLSQGCRPIGPPVTVTRADRQVIFELAGERPVDRIGAIWSKADPRDRSLMQSGLQLGVVVNEYKTDFEPGDFVVRPVTGADAETGVIAVGDLIEVGETVQFHVRDPQAADEDLQRKVARLEVRPEGALLFECNGRGTNLFSQPHHDSGVLARGLGVPLAGLFCSGELGPVDGRNFLHGFTASVALLVDSWADRAPAQ